MLQAFSGGWITGTTETITKCHNTGFRLKFWFVQIEPNVPLSLQAISEGVRSICKYMTESLVTVQPTSGFTETFHTDRSEDGISDTLMLWMYQYKTICEAISPPGSWEQA